MICILYNLQIKYQFHFQIHISFNETQIRFFSHW